MKSHLPRSRSAFTLIELLTVIAIIGILASILIPTVGKVRDSAKDARCKSNLRQVGLATQLYINEMGAFPTITGDIPWPNRLLPYFSSNTIRNPTGTGSNLYSPVDVVMCPSITIRPDPAATGFPRSYSGNPNLIFSTTATANAGRGLVRLENVKRQTQVLLFVDACQGTSATGNVTSTLGNMSLTNDLNAADNPVADGPDADGIANNGHPRYRHGGRANSVFVDASVRSFRKGELKQRNFSIAY
jgi:prepilin-type N-terminal cleavage/methylation domain-containing protein/prepilin-type processing-associated H-X9-DG protein